MYVTDKVGQQKQRLFLVFDREWKGSRPTLHHRYAFVYCADDIVVVGSDISAVIAIALNRHVGEVEGLVATAGRADNICAIVPVSFGVVFHSLLFRRWSRRFGGADLRLKVFARNAIAGVERRRQVAEAEVDSVFVGLVYDTAHAVRPWRGDHQTKFEKFLHFLFGIVVEQLIGNGADHLMTLVLPRRSGRACGESEQ